LFKPQKGQESNVKIQLSIDKFAIPLEDLRNLLDRSTFWARNRQLDDLQNMILFSDPVVSAWDGSKLIGVARATTDGVYRAMLWDVVVDPDYQSMGVGRMLVEGVLAHPLVAKVERIFLSTTYQQAFYKKLGFVENPATCMVLDRSTTVSETVVEVVEEAVV
jgi:ribosomal protein S18 acetylase RimI-like enzyme